MNIGRRMVHRQGICPCTVLFTLLLSACGVIYLVDIRTWNADLSDVNIPPAVNSYKLLTAVTSSNTSSDHSVDSSEHLPKQLKMFLNSRLPPFLKNYKNPCWREGGDIRGELRCLPYFHQIGAPKCGSTSLCSLIMQHPQVATVVKESMWIAREQFVVNDDVTQLQPLSQYVDFFKDGINTIEGNLVDGYHRKVFGDCSPATIWDNKNYQLLPEAQDSDIVPEPNFTNADYLHHISPSTKILVILRNPIDRLYSDYMFFGRRSYSLEGFDIYARNLIAEHERCLEKNTLRACVYKGYPTFVEGRHRIGIYYVLLKDFMALFPREQILVIKMEHFSKDVVNTMRRVYSFLELDPIPDAIIEYNLAKMNMNARRPDRTVLGDMLNSTRKLIYDFYKPYNDALVKLLGPEFDYN